MDCRFLRLLVFGFVLFMTVAWGPLYAAGSKATRLRSAAS